jgi:hypothetical protein
MLPLLALAIFSEMTLIEMILVVKVSKAGKPGVSLDRRRK